MAHNRGDGEDRNRFRVIFPGLTSFYVKTFFLEARSGDLSVYLYLPDPSGTRIVFPKNEEISWTFDTEDRWCTFRGWTFEFVQNLCVKNGQPLTDHEIQTWESARQVGENGASVGGVDNVEINVENGVGIAGGGDVTDAGDDLFGGDTFDPVVLEAIEQMDAEQRVQNHGGIDYFGGDTLVAEELEEIAEIERGGQNVLDRTLDDEIDRVVFDEEFIRRNGWS